MSLIGCFPRRVWITIIEQFGRIQNFEYKDETPEFPYTSSNSVFLPSCYSTALEMRLVCRAIKDLCQKHPGTTVGVFSQWHGCFMERFLQGETRTFGKQLVMYSWASTHLPYGIMTDELHNLKIALQHGHMIKISPSRKYGDNDCHEQFEELILIAARRGQLYPPTITDYNAPIFPPQIAEMLHGFPLITSNLSSLPDYVKLTHRDIETRH